MGTKWMYKRFPSLLPPTPAMRLSPCPLLPPGIWGSLWALSPTDPASVLPTSPGFYQEISLNELSAVELMGKLAELLALPANQIHHLFHQGPGGILILLNDQVNGQRFPTRPHKGLDHSSTSCPVSLSLPQLILFGSKNRIVLVTPSPLQVVQNLKDESYFVAVVKKGRGFRGRGVYLAGPRKGKVVFILSP